MDHHVSYIFCVLLSVSASCFAAIEDEAFLDNRGAFDFSFAVGEDDNDSEVDNLDVKVKLLKNYTTKTGLQIRTYDDVLNRLQLQMLRGLTTYRLGSWSYRLSEANVHGGQNETSPNEIPWANEINAAQFTQSVVGRQLRAIVSEMPGGGDGEYMPYMVLGHILRCGDTPKVHADASLEEDEVSMIIYLNERWRKNYYGDLYLYDKDREIVAGVVPRYGRVIVWQSSIPYLPRPPSVAFQLGQLFLHILFTKNQTKLNNAHIKWLENQKVQAAMQNNGFFLKGQDPKQEINVKARLVAEVESKEGKRIAVFDNLFSKYELDYLRSAILNHGVYYYDDSYEEESDNVQWIAAFNVDKYVQGSMWKTTKDVAEFVSGGHSEWFPYDVSCNLIRNADTTQIHHDCSDEEDEWTFLLYLNPEWHINDYGETVFYEKNADDTEILTEVMPKYGRVVIFQGMIPHSARPPSRNFTGARLSFAVKLSKNEWTAKLKACQEELRHISAVSSTMQFIKQQYLAETENEEAIESGQSESEEDFDASTSDIRLQNLQARLVQLSAGGLSSDIKKLRNLFNDVHACHLETREQVGELLRQLL